jgi:hypothetical protein
MVARGGVEPPTFRFSGTCSAAGQRVRALIPLDDPDTTHGHTAGTSGDGLSRYAFADYLEQHLTRTRILRCVPDGVWEALRAHTTHADDLTALARSAHHRGRYPHAQALHRTAAATGDPARCAPWPCGWAGGRGGRPTPSRPFGRRPPRATPALCTSWPGG